MRVSSFLVPTALALAAVLPLPGSQQEVAETLPTPYTAEQIRDAWTEGLEVWATVKMQGNEQASVMEVEGWSPEGATICSQARDAAGEPLGRRQCAESTWEELRLHGSFPAGRASRERHSETTPLGDLEGWLYRLEGEDGLVTESFFADSTPGTPAIMRRTKGGEIFFEMVMTRRVIPED